jgi:hypothetical protein
VIRAEMISGDGKKKVKKKKERNRIERKGRKIEKGKERKRHTKKEERKIPRDTVIKNTTYK